jgi:uncharacterized SAM-binding protein YcdF (DUF218 family)
MSDVILHLGGNWRRIERTALEAQKHPDALVLISTEGGKPQLLDYLSAKNISRERILIDDVAYDTVGNFTDTYQLVQKHKAKKVYVVTDDWHMNRAMSIASVAYAFTGITPIACPWYSGAYREDKGNTLWDVGRTLKWRIDGKPTSRNYKR